MTGNIWAVLYMRLWSNAHPRLRAFTDNKELYQLSFIPFRLDLKHPRLTVFLCSAFEKNPLRSSQEYAYLCFLPH